MSFGHMQILHKFYNALCSVHQNKMCTSQKNNNMHIKNVSPCVYPWNQASNQQKSRGTPCLLHNTSLTKPEMSQKDQSAIIYISQLAIHIRKFQKFHGLISQARRLNNLVFLYKTTHTENVFHFNFFSLFDFDIIKTNHSIYPFILQYRNWKHY